jgi:NAD(P)-dependent dehydrogenase (short-subunit alcohol dehydrogenase family)
MISSADQTQVSPDIRKFVLTNKNHTMNIIVTGASRGIGYETVKVFAKDLQNRVFAIARNSAGLEKLKNECANINGAENVTICPFDLVHGNFLDKLLPKILNKLDKIDILVNNAGLLIYKPFEMIDEDDFDLMFDANIKSVFKLTRYLLPYFSAGTHIVNIGSMGGFQGSVKFSGLSLYSASKGALAILTECLAEELKEKQIRVNCLALGSAQTEMLEEAFPGYRAPMTAAEMASFIADFSFNGHKFFNGKILPVAVTTP